MNLKDSFIYFTIQVQIYPSDAAMTLKFDQGHFKIITNKEIISKRAADLDPSRQVMTVKLHYKH